MGPQLPELLVDKTTLEFLEKIKGGVDWKPLPPNNTDGSVGVIFGTRASELKTTRTSAKPLRK